MFYSPSRCTTERTNGKWLERTELCLSLEQPMTPWQPYVPYPGYCPKLEIIACKSTRRLTTSFKWEQITICIPSLKGKCYQKYVRYTSTSLHNRPKLVDTKWPHIF
jgi:hypothetical protein